VCAGGHNHLLGADVPQPLARHTGEVWSDAVGAEVIGAALHGDDVIGVVVAQGVGTGEDRHLRAGPQLGLDPG
jgi:hypothetical protein